jgi:hypothetical protein
VNSCSKNDLPHKKLCQVTSWTDVVQDNNTLVFTYTYNDKRLLSSIILPFVTFSMQYDNHDRLIAMTHTAGGIYKLIYKQGRLAEILENVNNTNDFHSLCTYTYDNRGRIIERKSQSIVWRWEYIGNSRNFKRKIGLQDPLETGLLQIFVVYEYLYDNKVHPWSTWYNMPANPFYRDPFEGIAQMFEPIPENNWVVQEVYGYPDGVRTLGQQFYYSYEYDGDYPVARTYRRLGGNGDPAFELHGATRYTYDCKDNANGHLQ